MAWKTNRREFMAAATATALMGAPALADAAPVKIGLLTVKTGPLAQGGIQMEQGLALFLKDRGGMLAGRQAELVSADTGGSPAGAKTKAQELVERENVDFIVGPLAAFELLAITDYIAQAKVPMLSLAAADDMTQRKPNPWFIRASSTSSQCNHPLGDYAAKEMKLQRVATISEDFAFGYEQAGGFQRVFEDDGGKITLKLWPPLVTADYTPYLAQIQDVDGLWNGFAGSNPIKFNRQFVDAGLKVPRLGGWTAYDDALLKSFGDEALGAISAHWYSLEGETESNKKFVAGMQKEYGVMPGGYSAGCYVNGMCIEAALAETHGKTDDKKALIDALRRVSLQDTPRGPFSFDRFGNVVGNVYIRRLERRDGKLVNTIIKTYPNVSQFWTYDVEKYLASPVYSRDAAPVKI
jgi:branched-chain amino acid transport system substrate-binding protein